MAIAARLHIRIPQAPDAREIVRVASDAAIATIKDSIVAGFDPQTGAPRSRKGDGKPRGYNTGELANGIERTAITGGELRASTRIVPPASRRTYVEANPDVMTGGGLVQLSIDVAVAAHLRGSG